MGSLGRLISLLLMMTEPLLWSLIRLLKESSICLEGSGMVKLVCHRLRSQELLESTNLMESFCTSQSLVIKGMCQAWSTLSAQTCSSAAVLFTIPPPQAQVLITPLVILLTSKSLVKAKNYSVEDYLFKMLSVKVLLMIMIRLKVLFWSFQLMTDFVQSISTHRVQLKLRMFS